MFNLKKICKKINLAFGEENFLSLGYLKLETLFLIILRGNDNLNKIF